MVAFWLPNNEFRSRLAMPLSVTLFSSSANRAGQIMCTQYVHPPRPAGRYLWRNGYVSAALVNFLLLTEYCVSWLQPLRRPLTMSAATINIFSLDSLTVMRDLS